MGRTRSQRFAKHAARSTARQIQLADAPSGEAPSSFRWPLLWVSVGLVAANLLVYAAVRHYDFVSLDDGFYVSENPMVTAGLTWRGVGWAFTTGHRSNWHPLTWLSHMLDVQLYGMHVGGHHLTNVVLHIVNTLLLFGVLYRMTEAVGRSGFVAALFAVHPLHVESVAWVAERKDVLSTLFWMLTIWCYVSYVRQPRRDRYVLVVVCFALGLLAKPMLVTLPFVLLLLDYWPLGRLTSNDVARRNRADLTWSSAHMSVGLQLLREKLPLFALALTSSVVTFLVQLHGGAVRDFDKFPFDCRVANALVSYADYIGKMLWPARLGVFYPFPSSLPAWRVIAATVILIAVSAVALRAARRYRYLLVGWLWYLGTLVPVIGLVQVGAQSMADRYTYIPLIGLFLVVAWGVPDLLAGWRHRRIALATAAGIVVTTCAFTARAQVRTWENTIVLWQRVVEVTSGNSIAHGHLGDVLASQGKLDEAIAHYREVVRLRPRYVAGILSLANALTRAGRIDEAVTQYSEALRRTPDSAGAHNNLGVALMQQGRDNEATTHFAEAARLSPQFADAHRNLAMAFGKQRRLDEAISEMLDAMRLQPNQAQWHYDLALLYQWKGNTELAAKHLEKSLALDPTNQTARRALRDLKTQGPQ